MNLNECKIPNADGPDRDLQNFGSASKDGKVQVFFRDIEQELLSQISTADVVVGCIAWLTSAAVIEELSKKSAVSIVVQKEDFLRPDEGSDSSWKDYIQAQYAKLENGLSVYDDSLKGLPIHLMSYGLGPTLEAVRCVGNHNSERKPAFPRMHNKFMVFCKLDVQGNGLFKPYSVWTGSYNVSKNASNSFENAVLISDMNIVSAYFKEFGQIAALSENLSWENDWVEPEYRIGS